MKKILHKPLTTMRALTVLALAASFFAPPAFAQNVPVPQPSAATAPAPAGELRVFVVAVEGNVNIRKDENSKWEKATVGMVFGEGTEVKTGMRSAIQLKIEPNQTVILDRLGSCKIARAMFEGGKVSTDVVMPYGRLRYDVEAAGVEHDCKVHTPSSTLAIRGTETIIYDQPPFPAELRSLVGKVRGEFARKGRNGVPFGGEQDATMSDGDADPAEHAQNLTGLDSGSPYSRTDAENALITRLQSQNGIDLTPRIRPPTIGSRPGGHGGGGPGPVPVGNFVNGELVFTATWTGSADIDLFVTAGNRTLAQKNLGSTSTVTAAVFGTTGAGSAPSVGHVVGADNTGSLGTNTETIRIGSRVPVGNYKYGAFFQSAPPSETGGTSPTDVQLSVKFIKSNGVTTLANPTVSVSKDAPKQTRGANVTAP